MRLTKEMRDDIVAAAMHKAFDARDKAHNKATTALADALYQHEFGAAEKIANKLPENWCSTATHIRCDAAGFGWRGRHEGLKDYSLKMSKHHRAPNSYPEVKVGGAHPLNDQAQAVADEYQTIKRDKEALEAKLRALVCSVTTVPRLLEAWPECEQFLPTSTPKSTALVPVQLVPELNAALGITAKARRSSHV